jgi:hypothetical protein
MSWKGSAAIGAGLLLCGIVLFLAGAFVWTNNARHGGISPAVYWGAGVGLLGVVLLLASGIGAALKRRSPSPSSSRR